MKAFISHSSVDKEFVRTLKRDLNANGIATWLDEDQLNLGDSLIEKLDAGLTTPLVWSSLFFLYGNIEAI
jgi:hypothetical protein